MAAAMKTSVSAMETAGEGGPWGMALLAAYSLDNSKESLANFLNTKVFGNCTGIIAFLAILVKPVREWLFGMKDIREAQKCQLRSDMLHTYYKHREEDTIRQYEKENFLMEYKAYKRLKGNSFIDDIEKEIRTWDVIT